MASGWAHSTWLPGLQASCKCHFPRETSKINENLSSRQLESRRECDFIILRRINWGVGEVEFCPWNFHLWFCFFFFAFFIWNKLLLPPLETRDFFLWKKFCFLYGLAFLPFYVFCFFIFTFALSVKGISEGVQTGEERLAKFDTNHILSMCNGDLIRKIVLLDICIAIYTFLPLAYLIKEVKE